MTSILTKNLDIADFFMNDELDKIAEVSENLSEYSKTTDLHLLEDGAALTDKDFALILISPKGELYHKYAMQSRGLTELNLAFLSSLVDSLPDELIKVAGANLTKAAKQYNLPIPANLQEYSSDKFIPRYVDVLQIDETKFINKLASKKIETDETIYALKNKYPISTVDQVIKSAAWFDTNYTKLDIEEQQEFVENISSRIDKLNIKVASVVNDFRNLDKNTFNPELKAHLNIRKTYLKDDDENIGVFDELWEQKDEIGAYKVAYVLDTIDKELNLNDFYGHTLMDPLRSVLSTSIPKVASVLVGNKEITQAKLASLKSTDLGAIVGEGLVTELRQENGLIIFDTLPRPMQEEIAELL